MEKRIRKVTYTRKIADTTFIIKNNHVGTKTVADALEEIILSEFRLRYADQLSRHLSNKTKNNHSQN